jgi:phosphoribosylanthranilate isomerase
MTWTSFPATRPNATKQSATAYSDVGRRSMSRWKTASRFSSGRPALNPLLRNYIIDAFLLDTYQDETYGGTGKTFDWNVAIKAKEYGKVILSGGLNPENIEDAVKYVQPYGVDVSSGVELRPGRKDPKKIRDFIARARSVPLYYNEDLNNDEE